MTNESGRTMLEMLGVIAIIGVLTVGAISFINFGLQTFRVTSVFTLIETTASDVSDLYSWKRGYPTADQQESMGRTICENKIFDKACLSTNPATILTELGNLTVTPDDESQFTITLYSVPYTACNQLITMDWVNVKLKATSATDKTSCNDTTTDLIFTAY